MFCTTVSRRFKLSLVGIHGGRRATVRSLSLFFTVSCCCVMHWADGCQQLLLFWWWWIIDYPICLWRGSTLQNRVQHALFPPERKEKSLFMYGSLQTASASPLGKRLTSTTKAQSLLLRFICFMALPVSSCICGDIRIPARPASTRLPVFVFFSSSSYATTRKVKKNRINIYAHVHFGSGGWIRFRGNCATWR